MYQQNQIKIQVFDNENAWLEGRKGLPTSSRINELMAIVKRDMTEDELEEYKKINPKSRATTIADASLLSDGAISYILELIADVQAAPKFRYQNNSMDWGKENEGAAALQLVEELGLSIHSDDVIYTSSGGFVFYTVPGEFGGTPDLILPDAIAEIKCPDSHTHLYYKQFVTAENFRDEIPVYYDQMQLNMWLAKRDKCHFYSYDPRFKIEANNSHRLLIPADEVRQQELLYKIEVANIFKSKLLTQLAA